MIKTHKPRGYYWTHASAFQQTREFRNISYDECAAPTSRTLLLEPEERISESERATKRRRIEKLADDFLDGEPLFISSARPCPSALKSTIIWNKKSSNEPKATLPQVSISAKSTPLWQDVGSDGEVLRRYTSRSKPLSPEAEEDSFQCLPTAEDVEVQEAPARAISRPSRGRRSASTTAGPSEEALKVAAALRARKAQKAQTDPVAAPNQDSDGGRRLRSSEKQTEPQETSRWLSRRESHRVPADFNSNEDSLDELRLSNVETPSNPSQVPRLSNLTQPVARLDITRQSILKQNFEADVDTIAVTPVIDESSVARGNAQSNPHTSLDGKAPVECFEQNSYHTAPEETEIEREEVVPSRSNAFSQNDSQTRLLRSQGFPGTSRTSWQAVNKPPPHAEGFASMHVDAITPTYNSTDRRTRRATGANSKSTSDPPVITDQMNPDRGIRKQVRYTTQQSSANGFSPFKWRRKVTFPSSDEIVVTPKEPRPNKTTSQSAPTTPAASKPYASSATQTSARRLDVPYSAPAFHAEEMTEEQPPIPETWIGTQAMLFQAQRDLLTSPEKTLPTDQTNVITTASNDSNKSTGGETSQKSNQEPLKQLSQEPMPSTQALIGDFAGFSTVKKAWKTGPRQSLDSPTVLLKGGRAIPTPPDVSRADDWMEPDELPQKRSTNTGRSSNLRFSLESTDSPLHSTNVERHPLSTTPLPPRPADWSSTDLATSSFVLKLSKPGNAAATTSPTDPMIESNDVHASEESQSFSFSTAAPLPSFQAAQAFSSFQREDSSLDRTIDELTAEVLRVTGLEGVVLSQVG